MSVNDQGKRTLALGVFVLLGFAVTVTVVKASCGEVECPAGTICCDECVCCLSEDELR